MHSNGRLCLGHRNGRREKMREDEGQKSHLGRLDGVLIGSDELRECILKEVGFLLFY